MKSANEMVNSLLERREHYETEQKKKRTIITRTVISMCCFCLVALLGFGAWQSGLFNTTPPVILDGNQSSLQGTDNSNETKPNNSETPSVMPDAPIIWGESNGEVQDMGFCRWNGKRITLPLNSVLTDEKNKNCLIAIGVGFELDTEFVYNGKTISEYEAAVDDAKLLIDRLGELLKAGDELKYGETLYKTGTPNGKKWAKQLYDETVERIGKDVLSTYIVDGEFLKEKLESDIAAYAAADTSRESWEAAVEAYFAFAARETAKQLKEQDISCEVRNGLILYVTIEEFSALEIDNVMFYGLATKESEADDMVIETS